MASLDASERFYMLPYLYHTLWKVTGHELYESVRPARRTGRPDQQPSRGTNFRARFGDLPDICLIGHRSARLWPFEMIVALAGRALNDLFMAQEQPITGPQPTVQVSRK